MPDPADTSPDLAEKRGPSDPLVRDDAFVLSEMKIELDTFAAEVSHELASIRAVLSGSHVSCVSHCDDFTVPFDADVNESVTNSIGEPARPDRRAVAAEAAPAYAEAMSGHDRIAALKERLAAKLRSEYDPSQMHDQPAKQPAGTTQEESER